MVTAGMFEYNFGDSEFLMLFLVLVTLPYAAGRSTPASPACMTTAGLQNFSRASRARAVTRRRRPDARSFPDRRVSIAFRRRRRFRSCGSTTRAIASVARPTSPTTSAGARCARGSHRSRRQRRSRAGSCARISHKIGIDSSADRRRIPSRRTTRKLRVVTSRNQQVARIDYEDDREVEGDVEAAIVGRIDQLSRIGGRDSRLGLPQGRGVARASPPPRSPRRSAEASRYWSIPKVPHIDYYAGATVITPNHHEAEAVTHMRIRTSAEAVAAARRFRERAGCEYVLRHARRARHDTARPRRRSRARRRGPGGGRRHRRRRYRHRHDDARARRGRHRCSRPPGWPTAQPGWWSASSDRPRLLDR